MALAVAYGVDEGNLSGVGAVIYERLFGARDVTISIDTLGEMPVEWRAIMQIIGILLTDSRDFARVRGGGRPSKPMRKTMSKMVALYQLAAPADEFTEAVLADIACTLTAAERG